MVAKQAKTPRAKRPSAKSLRTVQRRHAATLASVQRENQQLRLAIGHAAKLMEQHFGGTVPVEEAQSYLGATYGVLAGALRIPVGGV